MAGSKERSSCMLSPFEKRLYCAKKRITKGCLDMPFLHRRCPYLVWTRDDVMVEAKRGSKEIVAWSGFTEKAIQYAERFRPRLRLVHRDETVKPRRRRPRVSAITV
jgi:septation ring formation regulator EzrA